MTARCHRCLTRKRPAELWSAMDKWGNAICNDCAECIHSVKLSAQCSECLKLEAKVLAGEMPLVVDDVVVVLEG